MEPLDTDDYNYKVKFRPIKSEYFTNKTSTVYGAPKTGKSAICNDILLSIRNDVPMIKCFNGTDGMSNQDNLEFIPAYVTDNGINKTVMEKLYDKQSEKARLEGEINDMKNLMTISSLINPDDQRRIIEAFRNTERQLIDTVENNKSLDKSEKVDHVRAIKDKTENSIKKALKKYIHAHRVSLIQSGNLTTDQIESVKRILFTANTAYFIDDCTADIKEICGKSESRKVLMKWYTNIRWIKGTNSN